MKNYKARDVDEFIKNAPEESRKTLSDLRALFKKAVPKAEESIKWGIPFYMYHGMLGGFSVFKKHASFGMGGPDLKKEDVEVLNKKGYETKKKIIQIRFDQKVPKNIITRLIKEQAKLNESKFLKK